MAQNVMTLSIFSLVIVTIIKSVRFNMQKVNKYIEYNVETTLLNESWSISVSDMCECVVRHLKYSDIVFFYQMKSYFSWLDFKHL